MPVLPSTAYLPPWWLRNAHAQTCWPTLFRKVDPPPSERVEIATPDDDFLELEVFRTSVVRESPRVLLLSHGLEGSARSKYNLGLAQAANAAGWDVVARNFRGCGPTWNRAFRLYHSGETDDLRTVVAWAAERWEQLALAGFSAGGNQTLRYLGQPGVHPAVQSAVAFSVPCDLGSSARRLESAENRIYLIRFLRSLKEKVRRKAAQYPGRLDLTGIDEIRDFFTYDDRYTGPMFGYRDAADYYANASSGRVLAEIRVPTLMVSALDDPFLTPECFPRETAAKNPALTLELTSRGGHVGFRAPGGYWSERRAVAWLNNPHLPVDASG